ncbi:MAG: chemotaxis protein CheW [Candidatus Fimivivens sp.]|nr:purine-binding chemotaxis protein CheW [Oscillospiraceae bacterium]MEA5136148.1 chemotaxis protein CheW [Candidatus Fimivivens sp.]
MNHENFISALSASADEMKGKYLTFWTFGQLLGIPISLVVQIVGMQEITPMPEFPAYAKGVINLRGQIIPVIDIRLRLNQPEAEYSERTCIIVASIHDSAVGFIVDEVDEVTNIEDDLIAPPPKMASSKNSYVTGIAKLQKKVALLIDAQRLLDSNELEALQV